MNHRMNRNRLNIGTYILQPYARTEAHIRDLRDAGIDFVVCMENDRKCLDLMAQYNVGTIVTGVLPGWWGGDGDNAGKLRTANPMEKYLEAAKAFEDHPAVWGVDVGDEPSALDFDYFGEVVDRMNQMFPRQFPYLNLYPNYASVAVNNSTETVNQLGTPTYAEHIEEYIRKVPTDYICYDFYVYSCNVPKAYSNLSVVADACRRTGRSMWIVLQVNSLYEDQWITENELRFQAYTAMAFGVENITWGCWTAGWWHNQVLDDHGERTRQYERLRTVNAEIHRLAEVYDQYKRTETYFVGFEGTPWLEGTGIASADSMDNGFFRNVRAKDGRALVIGDMTKRTDPADKAMFICAADDPYDKNPGSTVIEFSCRERTVSAYGAQGRIPVRQADGKYQVEIASNQGIIIKAK